MNCQGEIKTRFAIYILFIITAILIVGCRNKALEITICDLQGSGLISPYYGEHVVVTGIVTADLEDQTPAGFILQDESCQSQSGTGRSSGVFILISPGDDLIKLGDLVTLQGVVVEHAQETYLILRNGSLRILSVDNSLPAEVDLAEAIRSRDKIKNYENWEAMRVELSSARVLLTQGSAGVIWIYPGVPEEDFLALPDHLIRQRSIKLNQTERGSRIALATSGDLIKNLSGVLRQEGKEYVLQVLDLEAVSLSPTSRGTPTIAFPIEGDISATGEGYLTDHVTPPAYSSPTITPYSVKLLITEILPNPIGKEPDGEWIEIYNPEDFGQPLTGIMIGDESSQGGKEGMLRFPGGYYIEAREVLVVANSGIAFQASYGFFPDFEMLDSASGVPDMIAFTDWGSSTVQLSNSGDEVVLIDPWDQMVDGLAYGTGRLPGFESELPAPKESHSLERYPPERDRDKAGDWRERKRGSPGVLDRTLPTQIATSTPQPVPTNTPSPLPSLTATPEIPSPTPIQIELLLSEVMFNPRGSEPDGEWIEIFNPAQTAMPLRGVKLGDASGQEDSEGMLVFPEDAEVPPEGIILIANHGVHFETVYGIKPDFELQDSDPDVPDLSPYDNWSSGTVRLGNQGDEVLLLNGWDHIVDCLVFGDSSFEALQPAVEISSEGSSLSRYPMERDTDSAGDWISAGEPSPGDRNPGEPTTTPTCTQTASLSPTPSRTAISTLKPKFSWTPTIQSSLLPSQTVSITASLVPTQTLTQPSHVPSQTSTQLPCSSPTMTGEPTSSSTPVPILTLTISPSMTPTIKVIEDELVVINEIHPDPHPDFGDANRDGEINSDDDEFIEIVNRGVSDVDISGWEIQDEIKIRYKFPAGTILESNQAVLVFGGGEPTGDFGGSLIHTAGTLGLNNKGDTVNILDQTGFLRLQVSYGQEGNQNQSLTRYPDLIGTLPLILHSDILQANGAPFSPGTRVDGKRFNE